MQVTKLHHHLRTWSVWPEERASFWNAWIRNLQVRNAMYLFIYWWEEKNCLFSARRCSVPCCKMATHQVWMKTFNRLQEFLLLLIL